MTAAFFGSAFCFLINDFFDREKDLLNDKKRPIATGVLPANIAKTTAVIFMLGFLASTWFLGTTAFMLSFGFLAIALVYSYINAKTGLFANVTVALMVSGTQWGVAIIQPDDFLWVSSAFLFFLSIPREVLLDWLDLSGDEKSGKRSFPMNHSMTSTKWLVILCLILTTGTTYFVHQADIPQISLMFFVAATATVWISFIPFLRKANNVSALQGVRLSHVSFAFLILALFSR